jgi:lambda family phage portal protein
LTSSLQTWSGSINNDLDTGLSIMRARARALTANYEFAKRFLTLCKVNVVGATGPTLQVRAYQNDGVTLDKIANDIIEKQWYRWCRNPDIAGRLNFAQMCRIVISHVARDGEMVARKIRNRNLPSGFAIQLLDPDRLDETLNARAANGNLIRMGVELDAVLLPVAFHIKSAHPGDNYTNTSPRVERVAASDILHVYVPERAEQVRGYSWFHAVITRASMLQGYEDAAVVAARVGASKMGVFERNEESQTPPDLSSLADGVEPQTGNFQMSAEPGEFMKAPDGYKLTSWNPEYPHAGFADFVNQCMYGLSSGLDVAAHNLSGNMTGVNYSSARIAELSERDIWRTTQDWFFSAFVFPVYQAWLESAMIRGELTFPSGKSLPVDRLDKFVDASEFKGRTWAWVDPLKEIKAAREEIDAGLNSRTSIAAANGRDFESIVDELKMEKEAMEAAGITSAPPMPPAPPADPEDETDSEEDPDDETEDA